jgi:hypothetical protein
MTTILDAIDTVNPANNAAGVPLNNSIQILFDREVDEWSIVHGGLVVEGPDTDQVMYPGFEEVTLIQGVESNILETPGLQGLVGGEFTFQRISLLDTSVVGTSDTTGAGNLYRTKVIFKPNQPFRNQTNYNVYLIGQEAGGDETVGIRSKTVFDTITGSNTGNGEAIFSGTYLGTLPSDVLNIRITKAGVVGVAEFESWKDSEAIDIEGPTLTALTKTQVLDGVTVQFGNGSFNVGDTFSVKVKRPDLFTGTATYSFTTGNGSISVVPSSTATSITGDPAPLLPDESFYVISTSPRDADSMVDPNNRRITIKFSENIDPTSLQGSVIVTVEPIIDHPLLTNQVPAGPITHTLTASGNMLFIDL